jgi:hypothetical protein
MSQFNKAQFNFHGGYLAYGNDRKFVARFKYSSRDRAGFQSFLIKHFSVEEYFAALDAGVAPVRILETKGYVSATVGRILKDAGYPVTQDGFSAYIAAQAAKRAQASA